MAKFLKETSNILSNPDDVRAQALTLDYYTNENHPEILDGGEEWVCHISKDVSSDESALGKATLEVIAEVQKDIGLVTDYKTYCQYNTALSDSPFVHTDQWLLLRAASMKVDYIANVYITPEDVETESAWFEFFTANELDDSAEMEDYLKLTSDKLTALATKTFAYNKCLSFDSSIPHKNAPISTTPWGTDVTDSPLCFTVFITTS